MTNEFFRQPRNPTVLHIRRGILVGIDLHSDYRLASGALSMVSLRVLPFDWKLAIHYDVPCRHSDFGRSLVVRGPRHSQALEKPTACSARNPTALSVESPYCQKCGFPLTRTRQVIAYLPTLLGLLFFLAAIDVPPALGLTSTIDQPQDLMVLVVAAATSIVGYYVGKGLRRHDRRKWLDVNLI